MKSKVLPTVPISGVSVIPLKRIADERGDVLHMLRADAPHFQGFGEIYFSEVRPGAVKAWRKHHEMTINYAVPVGEVKLVLYDDREGTPSPPQIAELNLGASNYHLVSVPPGVWYGFKGLGVTVALIANCATLPHDESEIERADHSEGRFGYDWAK